MSERIWIALTVASFWGGTVFERKWWRWHRKSEAVVIESYELARDKQFVSEVERALLAACKRRTEEERVA